MSKKIFSSLAISLVALLMNAPVNANDNAQINNGLIPREPNFFQEGRRQFEREIELLTRQDQNNQEPVLNIDLDKLQIQEQLLRLEKPQVLPRDIKKPESN